jgi:hypothetical protein
MTASMLFTTNYIQDLYRTSVEPNPVALRLQGLTVFPRSFGSGGHEASRKFRETDSWSNSTSQTRAPTAPSCDVTAANSMPLEPGPIGPVF